ncbi:hypothetical protein [Rhodopseudomonas pseudopalustris]|uniref:Transmembrane protein n=1 Tax=Rhodopseudomonas palustris (strain BisB5) TaxID=316057 RepID=Q134H9_RHOPS|nr:hypothetical protein [Rhodopseudomonas pseudopalustris]ABE40510.1 conserved hypothetical protein [Rhodopseudomonas palustris BisB5]MBB1092036.1 hypothetical protein [Rhodopseudomonas palustris]
MTLVSSASQRHRRRPAAPRSTRIPIAVGGIVLTVSIAAVVYLLWPTWRAQAVGDPERTPVSVGETLFNVPTKAFRVKFQRHSGPQERVDLAFLYPSLTPPERPKRATAEDVAEFHPIDRIFVSIAEHNDTLAPEARLRTIYPRYLAPSAQQVEDGLTVRPFAEASPYSAEDLVTAEQPGLAARCTRDRQTPGMCVAERRIDGADLSFRFPRQWLAQWRDVAAAIERLTAQLHAIHG